MNQNYAQNRDVFLGFCR